MRTTARGGGQRTWSIALFGPKLLFPLESHDADVSLVDDGMLVVDLYDLDYGFVFQLDSDKRFVETDFGLEITNQAKAASVPFDPLSLGRQLFGSERSSVWFSHDEELGLFSMTAVDAAGRMLYGTFTIRPIADDVEAQLRDTSVAVVDAESTVSVGCGSGASDPPADGPGQIMQGDVPVSLCWTGPTVQPRKCDNTGYFTGGEQGCRAYISLPGGQGEYHCRTCTFEFCFPNDPQKVWVAKYYKCTDGGCEPQPPKSKTRRCHWRNGPIPLPGKSCTCSCLKNPIGV